MSKLSIDVRKINSLVVPNLENALQELERAIYNVNVLKIPLDFKYANYLKKLPSSNTNDKYSLSEKLGKIKSCAKRYEEIKTLNVERLLELKFSRVVLLKKSS